MRTKNERTTSVGRRLLSLLLALCIVSGLIVVTKSEASAADWMEPYLKQIVEWGIMRGDLDGNLNVDGEITRAEVFTMINRAYGYTEPGEIPFEDVSVTDWFYDDIRIAYKAGYLTGTGENTVSPNVRLTREEAVVLLGRILMLQESYGEVLGFTDSRDFSEWSRGMVSAAQKAGIVTGDDDGRFHPKKYMTRGEMAVMLVRALGTPMMDSGEFSLGNIYGNVTIAAPDTKLKDTTIFGDLYISGGVGLSAVELQNVEVLGNIIVSGAGESEKGENSVLLRNVTANSLIMDSFSDQFVTLQADGLTSIENVMVRASAYLEDSTDDGLGLQNIRFEGNAGDTLFLAGNVKDVVNVTPASKVMLAQGVAAEITVDEKAVGSTLELKNQTVTERVNLDTATQVIGSGDVDHMNINTEGTVSETLPHTITVRPGVTTEVNGEQMDTAGAAESSEDPRFRSGYPTVSDITTKGATVTFQTNKKGTIYWALTAMADGTVSEKDLLKPTGIGTIIKSGTLAVTASYTDVIAKLSGLTKDGSYYISAVLVDNRGMSSPVKIAAFVTPDDTTPAFASGYPTANIVVDRNDEQIIQTLVMPNKNCRLYYALYPKGATAPTAADFKANALTGNLGRGVVDLQKNTPYLVSKVNSGYLEEETEYELYLWLSDVDGAKSSAVRKLTIKTLDRTPPTIQHITENSVTAKAVSLTFALDEPGVLYWAVVKAGAKFYVDGVAPGSKEAMIQIESGINALKYGSAKASKAGTDAKLNISGLEAQTAYDLYYVAKDNAGNYCVYTENLTPPKTIYTLDNQPPTVVQEFTHNGSEDATHLTPYPDTSINLVFSENIKGVKDRDEDGKTENDIFLDMYTEYVLNGSDKETFAAILRQYIKLYVDGQTVTVKERNSSNDGLDEFGNPNPEEDVIEDWVIDYRNVKVEMDPSGTGQLYISFVHNSTDPSKSAINLEGGETYYFTLEDIADTSTAANKMKGVRGVTTLQKFTTISAQVKLEESYEAVPTNHDGMNAAMTEKVDNEEIWYFDMVFSAEPLSHESMADNIYWDMIIWSETSVQFKLYMKEQTGTDGNGNAEWSEWRQVGVTYDNNGNPTSKSDDAVAKISGSKNGEALGVSIGAALLNNGFEKVKDMENRLYAIEVVYMGTGGSGRKWNTPVTLEITTISGGWNALQQAGTKLTQTSSSYESVVEDNDAVSDITTPPHFKLTKIFVDDTPPVFNDGYPTFTAGDSSVTLRVTLDRPNSKFYYVIAPKDNFDPELKKDAAGNTVAYVYENMPTGGIGTLITDGTGTVTKLVESVSPNSDGIRDYRSGDDVVTGEGFYDGVSVSTITETKLKPMTEYIVFIVLQGESQESLSEHPYIFRFSTGDVARPKIELFDSTSSVGVRTSEESRASWFTMEMYKLAATAPFNYTFCQYIEGYSADDAGNLVVPDEDDDSTAYARFANAGYSNWKSMTVLQAMTANLSANDPTSVFDQYAGTEIYNMVYEAVVSTTGYSERRDQGTLETEKEEPDDEKTAITYVTPEMDAHPATYYYVIGAQNLLSSGNKDYAFKAIPAIHLPDTTPPSAMHITSVTGKKTSTGELKKDEVFDPTKNTMPGVGTYTGTVQIVFSEVPYRYYTDKDGAPVKELLSAIKKSELIDLIGAGTDVVTGLKIEGNALTISFQGLSSGDPIVLFTQGYISDSNGNTNKQNGQPCYLKLTFYARKVGGSTGTGTGTGTDTGTVEIDFTLDWVLK